MYRLAASLLAHLSLPLQFLVRLGPGPSPRLLTMSCTQNNKSSLPTSLFSALCSVSLLWSRAPPNQNHLRVSRESLCWCPSSSLWPKNPMPNVFCIIHVPGNLKPLWISSSFSSTPNPSTECSALIFPQARCWPTSAAWAAAILPLTTCFHRSLNRIRFAPFRQPTPSLIFTH